MTLGSDIIAKNKGLVFVSVLMVISDIIFILINYNSALTALESDIREWAQQTESQFNMTLVNKSISMQQLATFVANDSRVISLFKRGKEAVEAEGGGPGKKDAADLRFRLFDLVNPSWKQMSKSYDVRQLHFHLGPGSTSFLRVHRPEKFGDNMDDVRYTIVDANQTLKPTRGFETGRVYSGIRGVTPVFYRDEVSGINEHIGALEAGTSFSVLLESLRQNLDSDVAVLLTEEHIHNNMWKDFIDEHFTADLRLEDFFIEQTTHVNIKTVLSDNKVKKILKTHGSAFLKSHPPLQVCSFPLRDYNGTKNLSLPDCGSVVIWKDASLKWEAFNRSFYSNVVYAVLALFIIEILLFFSWMFSKRKLQKVIATKTSDLNESKKQLETTVELLTKKETELIEANRQLEDMASLDGLTQIPNRRIFDEYIKKVWGLQSRTHTELSVILCDIDFFKTYNDTYGHQAGDECLRLIAKAMSTSIKRSADLIARYGGEEFVAVLPETDLKQAGFVAGRIQRSVEKLKLPHDGSTVKEYVTLSIGIASVIPTFEFSYENLIKNADMAMYQAKREGRNRIVAYRDD